MLKQIYLSALLVTGIILYSAAAFSQEKPDNTIIKDLNETPKMAIGVKSERHLKGAIKIYEQLVSDGAKIENFEIVIWGEIVKELVINPELFRFIEDQQYRNLRLTVCQVAMDRLEVKPEDLPKGIEPVSNAWLRMLQLQAQGYNTIIP